MLTQPKSWFLALTSRHVLGVTSFSSSSFNNYFFPPWVDFTNILLTIFFCNRRFFGSFSLVTCKKKKAAKKTFIRKICAKNVDEIDHRVDFSKLCLLDKKSPAHAEFRKKINFTNLLCQTLMLKFAQYNLFANAISQKKLIILFARKSWAKMLVKLTLGFFDD